MRSKRSCEGRSLEWEESSEFPYLKFVPQNGRAEASIDFLEETVDLKGSEKNNFDIIFENEPD